MDYSKIHKKGIRFTLQKIFRDANDGRSKYGGIPALESLKEWPLQKDNQPMSFVGQLNFAEISKKCPEFPGHLPKEGILMFFMDGQKMLEFKDYYVLAYKKNFNTNAEFEPPFTSLKFDPYALVPEVIETYPMDLSHEDLKKLGIHEKYFTSEMKTNYWRKYCHDSYHQLLGYPYEIQDNPIVDILDLTNELPQFKDPQEFKNYDEYQAWEKTERKKIQNERLKIFEKKRNKWTLLWQIPSDPDVYGYFGDNGNIYIMIETEKLKNNDFSNLKVTWQSS